jgi:hypothetical protein
MARGVQMQQLLTDLRAEVGHSTSSALGVNMIDTLKQFLKRTQKRLWEEYDWPFLRTTEDKQLQAGSRYYDVPTNLTLERIESIHVKNGGTWQLLAAGVGAKEYNMYDSDLDERADPALKWMPYGSGQIEVWPLPNSNGTAATLDNYIRFTGIQNLSDFVAETDTADLDDVLITLYSAGELLARQKSQDADAKFQLAAARLRVLQGRLSTTRRFIMNTGEGEPMFRERLTAERI